MSGAARTLHSCGRRGRVQRERALGRCAHRAEASDSPAPRGAAGGQAPGVQGHTDSAGMDRALDRESPWLRRQRCGPASAPRSGGRAPPAGCYSPVPLWRGAGGVLSGGAGAAAGGHGSGLDPSCTPRALPAMPTADIPLATTKRRSSPLLLGTSTFSLSHCALPWLTSRRGEAGGQLLGQGWCHAGSLPPSSPTFPSAHEAPPASRSAVPSSGPCESHEPG